MQSAMRHFVLFIVAIRTSASAEHDTAAIVRGSAAIAQVTVSDSAAMAQVSDADILADEAKKSGKDGIIRRSETTRPSASVVKAEISPHFEENDGEDHSDSLAQEDHAILSDSEASHTESAAAKPKEALEPKTASEFEDDSEVEDTSFESLGLTDSDIDPDAAAKGHDDAFQMKVVGPSGHEMCVSETHNGYRVSAVKCADKHHGQQWYWDSKKLKNLNSEGRCLGYSLHASGNHTLSMFDCGGDSDYTAWALDETGRLKSADGDGCMVLEEDAEHNAMLQPCEE